MIYNYAFVLYGILALPTTLRLEEVLEKHIEAIDIEHLCEIQSLEMKGHVAFYLNEEHYNNSESNLEGSFTEIIKLPAQRYFESNFDYVGGFHVQCYDGHNSWVKDGGSYRPSKLNKTETIQAGQKFDIVPNLMQCGQKDFKSMYLGKKDIEGKKYHCIKLQYENGDELFYYLHTKSFLIRIISFMKDIHENTEWVVRYFDNYKSIDGIMFPHTQYDKMKYGKDVTTMIYHYKEFKINQGIDSTIFKIPQNP